jgi:hypothetical protein
LETQPVHLQSPESSLEPKGRLVRVVLEQTAGQFVSWGRQDALAVDAFSLYRTEIGGYTFPPFCLIQRCLMKALRGQAELTLVTPLWPAQTWFPLLLELACEPGRIVALLLPRDQLLLGTAGQPHPLSELLLQVAWQRRIRVWRALGKIDIAGPFSTFFKRFSISTSKTFKRC